MAKTNLKPCLQTAIDNVVRFGDTDIFPFPIENHILHDKREDVVKLLRSAYSSFNDCFVLHPPSHINTLCPVGQSGFRWATQQDPFWNAFLLGITLSIADDIEASRIPTDKQIIFSYRLAADTTNGALFRDDIGWQDFMSHSTALAQNHKFVVLCDIADCYQRVYHHRLENALRQLPSKNAAAKQIMEVLQHFSNTKSYGLPIGGPAARILVELVLNLTDQLLKSHQIAFCRYADDYHIFVDNHDEAYEKLLFISEKLLRNDGLSLQKSKTRIVSSAEFISTQSILSSPELEDDSDTKLLFKLKLRFDPYSSRADEQYEQLKSVLDKIDVVRMLNIELAKSRIHAAVTRRLVAAIRHLDIAVKENAILTLLKNLDGLYPVFPIVAITLKSCLSELSNETRDRICEVLRERVIRKSFLLRSELHAAFTVRVLSEMKTSDNEDILVNLYNSFRTPLVRRDVILAMAKWKEYPWLADQINDYSGVSPWEKRAFIIASYAMGDAGSHWRDHMKKSFNAFELLVRDWAAEKSNQKGWSIPI